MQELWVLRQFATLHHLSFHQPKRKSLDQVAAVHFLPSVQPTDSNYSTFYSVALIALGRN